MPPPQFISFKLKENGDLFTIGFDLFSINVLHQICEILDIEGHDTALIINVTMVVLKEVEKFVYSNHWILNPDDISKPDELKVMIDGYDLTFKAKPE